MELSMDEFARCLDIPASTIERWIRQGRIPVRRKGSVCEFNQPIIEKWAEANHLHFHPPGTRTEAQDEEESENNADSLLSVMRRGGVYYDIEGDSMDAVLGEAVERVPYFDTPEKKEKLFNSLKAREEMMSTGIGKGVAIPHPRTPMSDSGCPAFITTCFLKAPIDYQAIDKNPVFVLFLLISPTAKLHLHLLAQLSYCLRDEEFVELLARRPDAETLYARIGELAESMESSG